MKFRLVKLESLSGDKASIYSLYQEDINKTLFENFLLENKKTHLSEVSEITNRLHIIGNTTGARDQYFKLKEGNPSDGVCALYDNNKKKLRLYAVKFGTALIVLGGGGLKPKDTRALQETEKLKTENYLLRKFVIELKEKMGQKDIKIITNKYDTDDFEGDLDFEFVID